MPTEKAESKNAFQQKPFDGTDDPAASAWFQDAMNVDKRKFKNATASRHGRGWQFRVEVTPPPWAVEHMEAEQLKNGQEALNSAPTGTIPAQPTLPGTEQALSSREQAMVDEIIRRLMGR